MIASGTLALYVQSRATLQSTPTVCSVFGGSLAALVLPHVISPVSHSGRSHGVRYQALVRRLQTQIVS